MKKKSFFMILFIVIITIMCTGCLSEPTKELKSNDQLRTSYKPVSDDQSFSTRSFTMLEAFKDAPIIAIVSPQSEPESVLRPAKDSNTGISSVFQYREIKLTITDVLKGQTSEKVITISSPEQNTAFMDVLVKGNRYIFCLYPYEYEDENLWDTATNRAFYLSDSNQVIPMTDDVEHNKVLGIMLDSLKEMIKEADTIQ